MNNQFGDIPTLRESYYSLEIGRETDYWKEPVWVKKLRNILKNDIHQKSLGCRISNTHITIGTGTVHMGSFFEAQILFSHAKWIDRFAMWLEKELEEKTKAPCLIVGYETYIEPVLANLKARNSNINYCIYEEPKYTQRDRISGERLRYLEEAFLDSSGRSRPKIQSVVFLCGISSTLSSHEKMKRLFLRRVDELSIKSLKKQSIREDDFSHYSIVQILSHTDNHFSLNQDIELRWNQECKEITYDNSANGSKFTVRYLVDVDTEWQLAKNCRWCFPENHLQEKPLITTSATSVIPLQRIGMTSEKCPRPKGMQLSPGTSVLFEKKKGGTYYCQDYLYYDHVERGDHHFRYYIRTSKFLDHVLKRKSFSDFCDSIREMLPEKMEDYVHIILAPLHFSNDRFPHEINRQVFKNMAHVISFDPKSEYRSNFETKYSNYAYVLEQIKQINQGIPTSAPGEEPPKICFYYVDDEIISGNTFSRAKSFVSSLMRKYSDADSGETNSYKIFSAVITLIDRSSGSSKLNYVDSPENYHSFVHLSIPSLRNYGDACPLCKQIEEAQNISNNCCLNSTAQYWREKERHLRVRTLEEAREQTETEPEKIRRRHFIRLYCENKLWENTISLWTEGEIASAYLTTIHNEIKGLCLEDQYEFLISFIKAFSRPFLHNKEDGKKAALRLLMLFLDGLLASNPQAAEQLSPDDLVAECDRLCIKDGLFARRPIKSSGRSKGPMEESAYILERYFLLCVLISCLSAVGSTYLLKSAHIEKLCGHVTLLNPEYNRFAQKADDRDEIPGFYTVLVNNFKNLVCGVSGREKSSWADRGLWQLMNNTQHPERIGLYRVLYLENIQKSAENTALADKIQEMTGQSSQGIIRKYHQLGRMLSDTIENSAGCTFYAAYGNQIIELTENVQSLAREQVFSTEAEAVLKQIGYYEKDGCFWIVFQQEETLSNDISQAYLKLSFPVSDVGNYQKVRRIMILRAEILRIIRADVETGALKAAIQVQAAESILLTDKTQSHGQSNDINQLFEIVYKQLKTADRNSREDMCNAYGTINLFMNRCIAFGATKAAMKKYFMSDLSSVTALQPFSPQVGYLTEQQAAAVHDDMLSYLKIIQDHSCDYIQHIKKYLKKKHDDIRSRKIDTVKTDIKVNDLERFKEITFVPYLLNIPEARASAITLIGIIDVFIRNAIEHAGTDCDIQISCGVGEHVVPQEDRLPNVNYSSSYHVTVENSIGADSEDAGRQTLGFTKLFLTEYLRALPRQRRYFQINMGKIDTKTFRSQLICITPEIK